MKKFNEYKNKRSEVDRMVGVRKEKKKLSSLMKKPALSMFLILTLLLLAYGISEAVTQTTVGEVATITAKDYIGIVASYTGDDTTPNNTLKVEYKLSSEPTIWTLHANLPHSASPYRTQITGLTEGTKYDVRVTYNDANGVIGTNPVIIYNVVPTKLMHTSYNLGSSKWGGKWGTYESGSKYGEFTCGTCHKPRTTNIKGVIESIIAPNSPTDDFLGSTVNFQSVTTPNGFGDDTGGHATSTKICEVCHSQANYHKYNQPADPNHYNAQDCTGCHSHKIGFGGGGACNACHGAPPGYLIGVEEDTNAPAQYAASHSTHYDRTAGGLITSYTSTSRRSTAAAYVFDCGNCHSNNSSDHMANTDGTVDVNLPLGGTFTRGSTATNNTPPPGSVTFKNYDSTCSSLYCHSDGIAPYAAVTNPVWGNSTTGECGDCHYATAAAPPTRGSHNKHASSSYYSFGCQLCHNTTTTTGNSITDKTVHVNEASNWSFSTTDSRTNGGTYNGSSSGSKTPPSITYYSCANLYCHSNANPMGGTNDKKSIAWNGSVTCTSCHSNTGGGGTNLSTRHADHFTNYNYGCIQCHNDTVSNNTTIKASGYAKHVNTAKDVAWGTLSSGGDAYASPNCTNIYCHSKGTSNASPFPAPNVAAAWNTTFADLCISCHSGDATKANKMATNKHGAHINDTANAVGKNIGCQECHRPTVSDNTTVATYANHVNRLINVGVDNVLNLNTDSPIYAGSAALSTPGMTKAPGSAIGSCANFYCHSSGNLGAGSNLTFRTIAWNATIGCDGCHGNQAGKVHPVYATGGAGNVNANSHVKHVEGSSTKCDTCHLGTTTDIALPPTTVVTGTLHINRVENVTFNTTKAGASAAWTAGTKTCSTTYCHGTAGIQWGATLANSCDSCHAGQGAGVAGTKNYTGPHYDSVNSPDGHTYLTKYKFACENCHRATGTAHAGGDPFAGSQTAEIAFSTTAGSIAYGGGATMPYVNLSANPYGAAVPSPGYVAGGVSAGSDPVNASITWTAGTCSSVWCHSTANPMIQGAEAQRNAYISPTWTGALGCATCHLGPDTYANMTTLANRLSTSHAEHIANNRYGLNANFTCNTCHDTVADNNTTINITTGYGLHVDGSKKVQLNAWAGGSWLSPNCSTAVYCHSTGNRLSPAGYTYRTIAWNTTIPACISCHLGPDTYANMTTLGDRLSTAHAKHKATNSPGHGANTNFTCNSCHSTVASSDTVISSYTLHVNKTNNVSLNAWAGGTWSGSPGYTCSNTYCHSKGTGGTLNAGEVRLVLANTSVAWTATTTCGSCHGEGAASGIPSYANLRRSPTAAVGTTWTNPTNVYNSDDSRAVYTATRAATPVLGVDYLSITGFGFTLAEVPDTATITDITVLIEGNGTSATLANREIMVSMVKGGVLAGTAKTAVALNLTSDTEVVLGGNNDLWGAAWLPSDIRAANFGVAITDDDQTGGAANALNIDRVRIVVHYTGGTIPTPKQNSHAKHTAYTCDKCHNSTTTTGNTITTPANHVDKTYDVIQGTGVTFTYSYAVAGGSCATISCHSNAQWGVSEMNCVTCHTATAGTRRAIVPEFGYAWSHKRSAGGAVTPNDCCVCHMEGTSASNPTATALHKNGVIDLRDPDLGTAITGFADFIRNTASATRETWVIDVQTYLCLKCHDANGATSALAQVPGGSALRPFGTAPSHTPGNNVLNVDAHFATTNATFHPIKGAQNNAYCSTNTMVAPWNTKAAPAYPPTLSNGPLISCWDCHNTSTPLASGSVTAHGNAVTIRGSLTYNASYGTAANQTGSGYLCDSCHKDGGVGLDISGVSTNSAFGGYSTGLSTSGTRFIPGATASAGHGGDGNRMQFECLTCHGSTWLNPGRPRRAEDFHGFNKVEALRAPTVASGTSWTTATNVYLSDGAYASYNTTAQNDLIAKTFGFIAATEVPTGSTISGITVIIEGYGASATDAQRQIRVGLTKDGTTLVGTRKTGVQLGTTDFYVMVGGTTDLWGTTWAPADVQSANFGVLISDNDATAAAIYIDRVTVIVHTNTTTWGTEPNTTQASAKPYAFLRNTIAKDSATGVIRWDGWRPRYDAAAAETDHTTNGWGCSWSNAASSPCSRSDHSDASLNWVSYGPGGKF